MGGAVSGFINKVTSNVTNFVQNVESKVSEAATGLLQKAVSGFEGFVKNASSAISSLSSGGMPSISSLFSKLLGAAGAAGASQAGSIEQFLKDFISKLPTAQLENGATVNTGAIPERNMTAEMAQMQQVLAAMVNSGQLSQTAANAMTTALGGTAAATGAATAAPATTNTATAGTNGNPGNFSSIINNMQAQNTGGTDGLSSAQSNILAQIKDENLRAQTKAQMQAENLTRDSAFFARMAQMMDEALKDIIRKF